MVRDLLAALKGGEMQSAAKPQTLENNPIKPDWIKEGVPEARSLFLTISPDEKIKSGIWECTAGRFTWIFDFDEVIQILEGEVRVESEGEVRILTAGSTAFFPYGLKTHWHVPKYVKKFFTHRYPSRTTQLARKVGSALRRGMQPVVIALAMASGAFAAEAIAWELTHRSDEQATAASP
jgi:uncharacterized cupin superfamily protein